MHKYMAFQSQYQEIELETPSITGHVPQWLSGRYISNGPAQFEINTLQFKHWFDGLAMLKTFEFNDGSARFKNQFLASMQYQHMKNFGTLKTNEFGLYKDSNYLKRGLTCLSNALSGGLAYDNCNVNIAALDEHYVALTESQHLLAFNPVELNTLGVFQFNDNLKGQLSTAHPQIDKSSHAYINILIQIGRAFDYHIYQTTPKSNTRSLIQTYRSTTLFYMHSFCLTENYVVLFKTPLVLNPMKLLFGLPFNHALSCQKNLAASFVVINKNNGEINEVASDVSFTCLHQCNAYEVGNTLVLNLVIHPVHNPYDDLYLDNLRAAAPILPTGQLVRFQIEPQSKRCRHEVLSAARQEFPRGNEQIHHEKTCKFIYTSVCSHPSARFFDQIQKINLHSGETTNWKHEAYLLGEAVFVAHPRSKAEDHGVLLCIAYHTQTHLSSLVILDAQTMQHLAEVHLPFHLPIGLHGQFYDGV